MRIALWIALAVLTCAPRASKADEAWHRTVRIDVRIEADGNYDTRESWEVRADDQATGHVIAQQSFGYSAGLEQTSITTAFTRKSNGSVLPVDLTTAVLPQAIGATVRYPSFTDWQSRSILFPDVAPGDTVHFELHRHTVAPLFPGAIARRFDLGPHTNIEAATVTINAPANMHLGIDAHDLEADPAIGTDRRITRTWHLRPRGDGEVTLDVSTFHDYPALGQAFASRALARSEPDATVRALAGSLVAGVEDRRDRVQRLYEWVAVNIRYVDVQIGHSRVVPHPAELILRNRYGDCKDHAILLQALLAAAGIGSHPALIASSYAGDLPTVPTMAVINHVILFVPEFSLFLDSTSPFAAFGTLPFNDTGKPVVVADPAGSYMARTPALRPDATQVAIRTDIAIDTDGIATGQTETSGTGPAAITLREIAVDLSLEGSHEAAARILRANGTPGHGSLTFADPYAQAPAYAVTATFTTRDPVTPRGATWLGIPSGLPQLARQGSLLIGTRRHDTGHACFAGRQTEDLRLTLPPGTRVAALPHAVQVAGGPARYQASYRLQSGTVVVHRELVVDVDRPVCSDAEYNAMTAVLSAIHQDLDAGLALQSAPPPRPHRAPAIAGGAASGMNG